MALFESLLALLFISILLLKLSGSVGVDDNERSGSHRVVRHARARDARHSLRERSGDAAVAVRTEYEARGAVARNTIDCGLTRSARSASFSLRCAGRGEISDDAFHRLEEELDWAELHARREKSWNCLMRSRRRDRARLATSPGHIEVNV
jgi:hypothetical protein